MRKVEGSGAGKLGDREKRKEGGSFNGVCSRGSTAFELPWQRERELVPALSHCVVWGNSCVFLGPWIAFV